MTASTPTPHSSPHVLVFSRVFVRVLCFTAAEDAKAIVQQSPIAFAGRLLRHGTLESCGTTLEACQGIKPPLEIFECGVVYETPLLRNPGATESRLPANAFSDCCTIDFAASAAVKHSYHQSCLCKKACPAHMRREACTQFQILDR